jgi:site-specific recombinase XerD
LRIISATRKAKKEATLAILKLHHFDQYLGQYLNERHQVFNHQLSGVEANRRDLNLFSQFCHQSGCHDIDGDALLTFIGWLKNDRTNGAGAINRKISSVRSYIKYLRFRQVDGADQLPVEYLPRARQPYGAPYQTLLAEEVKQLLFSIDCCSILGYRDYLLYSLLYRLGLRIGEAIAINVEDIDMQKQIVTIHGKGRRQRVLPLISDVAEMIQSWLTIRTKVYGAQEQKALFVSKKGNRLSVRTAQENFQKIVSQAGPFSIKKITPHSLRHAFATHAIEGDADIVVLKAVMGHASIHTTQIYIHPSLETLRKAVNDHIASDILADLIEQGTVILRMQQKWKDAA